MSSKRHLGIQGVAALHLFVHDLKRARNHFVDQLDFAEVAVSTEKFEAKQHARASVVQAGNVRFMLMQPLSEKGESYRFLQRHPEGIGRVVFDVDDVAQTFALIQARHGTPVCTIREDTVGGRRVRWFDVATPIGDTLFRFVESDGTTPVMPDLRPAPATRLHSNRFGFGEIDHITSNFMTLQPALAWFQEVMGFEPHWEVAFHTQDVAGGDESGSGLRSVVMRDPSSGLKFANNEPAAPCYESSQIALFCADHGGPGIQHVALTVPDLPFAVQGLEERAVQFMPTPDAYFDMLPTRLEATGIGDIDEDVETLRKLGILVDGCDEGRYLLQIFMRETAVQFNEPSGGPMFIELIQRKGDKGFGAGNFRALFESIERQQQTEGRA